MLNTLVLATVVCCGVRASEAPTLDVNDEVVCRVNKESISKRQVEDRMEPIAMRLYGWRKQLESAGQWNEEMRKKWDDIYIPSFRDSLRLTVKERLMLQYAKDQKVQIDEIAFNRQVLETIETLKKDGLYSPDGFSLQDVQKRVREQMLLRTFRSQYIVNFLDSPNRPEVQLYYEANISRYQRKAGTKVRLIRVDRFVTNKLTGKTAVRENAYEDAQSLLEEIVTYKANFGEVAKRHSDERESGERGGLLVLDAKDPYIDPESYNAQLAKALRGLKKGDVSKVFELGQTSWAFAYVEDTREAGPAPLEGPLYEEIFRTLEQEKSRKKEHEWLRKAIANTLIDHVVQGTSQRMPMEFFFADEEKNSEPAVRNPRDAVPAATDIFGKQEHR